MNNQEISANPNGGNEDGMDESAFTTPSLAESEISIAEKMQKIESELLALKRSNEIQREQAAPTMMQVGWQIGEKFCKLEMKVDGQDKEIAGFRGENKELKCENGKLKEEIAGLKAEMVEKDEKMQEMSNELAELRRESGQFKQAIVGNKRALDSKFDELQTKMARFEENQQTSTSGDAVINQQCLVIYLHQISNTPKTVQYNLATSQLGTVACSSLRTKPILMILLFECIDGVMNGAILSLENQLFSFMTNSNALKHNKWEKNESGLKFGEDGFTVNSNAPKGFKTVSAEFPIRLFNIVGMVKRKCVLCYFEVKLMNGSNVEKTIRVGIGFCGQDFPLDGVGIGGRSGSIGLYCPEGMSIDGQLMPFEEQNAIPIDTNFRKGDIVGCGLLYSPTDSTLRCFATLRGKFIGSILLRPKYHTRMLYPAASLYFDQESIRANFGAQPFHFNPTQLLDK